MRPGRHSPRPRSSPTRARATSSPTGTHIMSMRTAKGSRTRWQPTITDWTARRRASWCRQTVRRSAGRTASAERSPMSIKTLRTPSGESSPINTSPASTGDNAPARDHDRRSLERSATQQNPRGTDAAGVLQEPSCLRTGRTIVITDVFIDGVSEAMVQNGSVRVNLVTLAATERDAKGQPVREVRHRLLMSPQAATELHAHLEAALRHLSQAGIVTRKEAGELKEAEVRKEAGVRKAS